MAKKEESADVGKLIDEIVKSAKEIEAAIVKTLKLVKDSDDLGNKPKVMLMEARASISIMTDELLKKKDRLKNGR